MSTHRTTKVKTKKMMFVKLIRGDSVSVINVDTICGIQPDAVLFVGGTTSQLRPGEYKKLMGVIADLHKVIEIKS